LPRPVSVSARELARWLRRDAAWLVHLADAGELPARIDRKGYQFDPRCMQDWVGRIEPQRDEVTSVDLEGLKDLSLVLTGAHESHGQWERVLEYALGALGAEAGGMFLVGADEWLRVVAATGVESDSLPPTLEGVAVWVGANAEPLLLPDPRRVERLVTLDTDDDPRDALAVPFLLDGRVLGVLVAMRGLNQPRFTDAHLTIATMLGTELALSVERNRMHFEMGRKLGHAQSQLEAYAVDVREVFAAEKKRSVELLRALDELRRTYLATVRGLAVAVEAKDEYTAGHLVRVTRYGLIMLEMLAPEFRDDPAFEYGFLLHDIGKLGIPDAVLTKNGPLTEAEWRLMRRHPAIGVRILEDIPFLSGARETVEFHHERWDGLGYPSGLRGEEIPLGARLFAVADAFDAMTTHRPYRNAMSIDAAIAELHINSGTQFWPDAVEALLSVPKDMLEVTAASAGSHSHG
jgi:HD-GYP domain-containing protein (c-di-GMP phosphodiesterase class II)